MAKKVTSSKKPVKLVKPIVEQQIEEVLPKVAAKEVEKIVEEVEASAPKRAKETDEEKQMRLIQGVVKAVMSETVPALMAMQVGQSSAGSRGRPVRQLIQCRECKQAGPGKAPCNGEHIKMVVYPQRYPEFGKWFQGSIINGIRYLSNNRREQILVPAACEGQIIKQITDYEENERVTRMGRTAEHDSGSLAEGGGGRTQPANAAWR